MLGAAIAATSAAVAFAFGPVGPPGGVRVSVTGSEGEGRSARGPAVAFNPRRREYLIVWSSDAVSSQEFEIFGRRVSRAGRPIGPQIRISAVGTDGDATRDAEDQAVAYNRRLNQYLVVWHADGLPTNNEAEIFGQRLGPTGAELGGDFRISTTGTDGDPTRDAESPAITHNPKLNQYLVVWQADGLTVDNDREIFGQRLGASGTDLGGDFRVSITGTDGNASFAAILPSTAFNSRLNQYLVAWDSFGGDREIFAQRLGASGAGLGGDFQISNTGGEADTTRTASDSEVAYSARLNQYLVVWVADGFILDDSFEVAGQRLAGRGTELGRDFRISTTGPDTDADRDAYAPVAAYSPRANEYLVGWYGAGLATDDEFEIFGQRVGAGGRRLDPNIRISTTGADGDHDRIASSPAIAFGADQHLVAWEADGLATDDEFEIFGRRVRSPRCAGKPATRIGTKGRDVIRGTRRRDVIVGLAGNDRLLGRGGNDLICGGKGRDRLAGGKGRDRLLGGPGRDRLRGGPGRDRVRQ
jgi:hypothetical protein